MEVPVDVPSVVETPVVPVVDAPVVPVVDAPVVVEAPVVIESAPVEVMDGGAKHNKHKAKRRYSPRRKSASKRSSRRRSSSRSRKMGGGEFGFDAFGRKDLGQLPKKKNFPYSGATRIEDVEAINEYLSNPAFTGAESAYEKLAKLHKQMMKANLSPYDAKRLLEEVKAYDQTSKDGTLPQWIVDYSNGIDDKIDRAEAALDVGDDSLAASYEWQAAIEEKKLAYMIMEALSGVAVGSGEDARSWRTDRAEGYTSPLGWETGFSGAASSSSSMPPRTQYTSIDATKYQYKAPKYAAEQLAQLKANEVKYITFVPRTENSIESPTGFQNIFSGGKKHMKHGLRSRSRCSKGKVFDRDTKRCRNPKSKSKSKSRSRKMGGGKKCSR